MKKVTSIELTVIKGISNASQRTNKSIKKIEEKKALLDAKIESLQSSINLMEEPIKTITGGLTSLEYLQAIKEEEAKEVINTIPEVSKEGETLEEARQIKLINPSDCAPESVSPKEPHLEEGFEEDLKLDAATIADTEEDSNIEPF